MTNASSATSLSCLRTVTVALTVVSATISAQAQVSPVGAHHTTVGQGGGLESPVSPTGGYITSVNLDLPRPRGPLPVPLSIVYTGSRRGGAAGESWDVPFAYVRRSVSHWRRKPEAAAAGVNSYVERLYVSTGGGRQLMVPNGGVYVPFTSGEYQELRADGSNWRLRTLGVSNSACGGVLGCRVGEIFDYFAVDGVIP